MATEQSLNKLPEGGNLVKRRRPTGIAGVAYVPSNPDSGFTKHKTPTSNDSGRTFYRNKSKGEDGHEDPFEYDRVVSYSRADQQGAGSGPSPSSIAGIAPAPQQQSLVGNIPQADTSNDYVENVSFVKRGRAAGTSATGDKQPQRAKRAKYVGSDRPSAGGRDNKQATGTRSTILTGARGLGNVGSSKTLLGG